MAQSMQSEVVEYFQQYDELWKQQDARALVESKWTTDGPFFIAPGFPEVHGREGIIEAIDGFMKKGGAFIKHTAKESEGSIPDNQIGYAVVDTVVSSKDGKAVESVRSLNVLKKEGGELKLHGVMFNRAEQKEPVASSDTK